LGHLVQG